jgi:hypothetical protein
MERINKTGSDAAMMHDKLQFLGIAHVSAMKTAKISYAICVFYQ